MRSLLRLSSLALPLLLAAPARAATSTTLEVSGGPGQAALAVQVEGAKVRAKACASAPCAVDGGVTFASPEGGKAKDQGATLGVVTLSGGRKLARVEIPGEAEGSAWVMLVAAPLSGKPVEPLVLWSGWTGAPRGEAGEERSAAVVIEGGAKGQRALVGERRADVTLCGRPTLVAAQEVDAATMTLARGASVQNLTAEERGKAVKIAATRGPARPFSEVRALRATAATSAYEKKLAALTDGDGSTAWSENRAGDGRGEFVSMSAPEEVGINALDVVVRPTEDVPEGAAPKRFYVATGAELFEVTMPEDAWRQPAGTRYTVKFPADVHASCVAVVLDEAYARGNARVTIAEVEARTAFDGASAEALAGALAGGGARAKAAAALLARAGKAGFSAAIAAYDKLDDEGRRLAAGVVDGAPCSDQVPFFAARFAASAAAPRPAPGEVDPELSHARDRLRRCGRASAGALAKIVAEGKRPVNVLAADELAALAPAEAVPALLTAIGSADDTTRRDLRAALARAAKNPRAFAILGEELAPAKITAHPEMIAVDLLRAAGPSLTKIEGAADAFAAIGARATSFRARYLLQAPAAELARGGDARAIEYVRRALREDEDPHVRARAAEVASVIAALAPRLVEATADGDPRVREAAVAAIAEVAARGESPAPTAPGALRDRLARDDWTFVRAGAARTLGALPADAESDRALAAALTDAAPDVRGRALDALGGHRAIAYLDAIRARQDDDSEDLEVRARAILALGSLCDRTSIEAWTKLARALRAPADDRDRRLGGAAIAALGQLHPADLAARLAPLDAREVPLPVREMAKAALTAQSSCQ